MIMKKLALGRNKNLGIGLLELMLSLAIIAILLIMATRFYSTARRSEMVNETVDIIGVIKSEAGTYWYHHHDLSGFDASYIVGSLPSKYTDGTNIIDPWNTDHYITISSASGNSATIVITPPTTEDASAIMSRLGMQISAGTTTGIVNYKFSVAS